jgi:hypothetical protein
MKSFNAYGQTTKNFGSNIPVWLGTVSPIPMGAMLEASYVKANTLYKAGTPVEYNATARTFKPMANAEDSSVTPNGYLYNDIYIDEVGENTAATGAIVINHPEGLLIENTAFADIADTLAEQIPGVLLVRNITA